MDPSRIYSMTLSQLDDAEIQMTSPQGDALIQAAPPAEHRQAVLTLLKLHQARIALGNATLQGIADKLTDNEAALKKGTADVNAAVTGLNNLAQILNTVAGLIGVVAKVVPLV